LALRLVIFSIFIPLPQATGEFMSEVPIICITNRKGGVGKSTLTGMSAIHLAEAGKNVIVIDLDSIRGSTVQFFSIQENFDLTICDVLRAAAGESADGASASNVFFRALKPAKSNPGTFDPSQITVIPSVKPLEDLPHDSSLMLDVDILKQILTEAIQQFPKSFKNTVIFIDTAPDSFFVRMGIVAASHVLVPFTLSDTSIEGTVETLGTLRAYAKRGKARPFGMVPIQVNMNVGWQRASVESLADRVNSDPIIGKLVLCKPGGMLPAIPQNMRARQGDWLSRPLPKQFFRPLRRIYIELGILPPDSMPPEEIEGDE
jgi:cellulose biosynthesis protein BcsQ